MFTRPKAEQTELDHALDRAIADLNNHEVMSKEYDALLDRIAKLAKMKEDQKPESVSKDTQAMIAANLLGILLIVGYEHAHVITSKALPFVNKAN